MTSHLISLHLIKRNHTSLNIINGTTLHKINGITLYKINGITPQFMERNNTSFHGTEYHLISFHFISPHFMELNVNSYRG